MTGSTGAVTGVGLTALMVAAARAIETHRPDALCQDPYAEHFVRAAPASATWPIRPEQVLAGATDPLWNRLGRYFGLRTRTFDDAVTAAGHRQVVLLGAGLDSRAFRLRWPAASTVFEIDQPGMLAFKQSVLDGLGAQPTADRRAVPVDLRDDWAQSLVDAGFRPSEPTTWLAEGLLLYLPSQAEQLLIETVYRLSTPGSSLTYEVKLIREAQAVRDSPVYVSAREQLGIDLLALFSAEPRPDSAAALTEYGWDVRVHTPYDFTRRYGRGPLPEPNDALAANRWVFATTH